VRAQQWAERTGWRWVALKDEKMVEWKAERKDRWKVGSRGVKRVVWLEKRLVVHSDEPRVARMDLWKVGLMERRMDELSVVQLALEKDLKSGWTLAVEMARM
jgi:hypothetical protein